MVYNADEHYVQEIANTIPNCYARLATAREDCGRQKADVVINYQGNDYFVQVSHTPKSKKEQENLERRGTYSVHTHKFQGMSLSEKEIKRNLERILEK